MSRDHLARLPEPERRAAAIEGLQHGSWRVRRTCAQLLDRVDLTPESVAALTRALDDEHPQVRRKAKAGRVYDRELTAGGRKYWVAPPGTVRPRIP